MSPRILALTIYAAISIFTSIADVNDAMAAPNEPAFCRLETFVSRQVEGPNIMRSRTFRFGDSHLVVGGIGKSQVSAVVAGAREMAKPADFLPQEKFCTWYYNDGNDQSAKAFRHQYVSNPDLVTFILAASPTLGMLAMENVANEYQQKVIPNFSRGPVNFMSCLQNHKYVALGCDGNKHRGPTIFAMLLAYSGCTPRTSVDIAVALWGQNWVLNSTRIWIARRAYAEGARDIRSRQAWQKFFSQP